MEKFFKGYTTWIFSVAFLAVFLLFLTKDANPRFAACSTLLVGSACVYGFQWWYYKKYNTPSFDHLKASVGVFVMIVFALLRSLVE